MRALILVDIQNDFLPGGALAVPKGNEVIEVANRLIPNYDLVVATQDWHPAGHLSFASSHPGHEVGQLIDLDGSKQILWPDHCVQDSVGAQFASSLNDAGIHEVVPKGTDRSIDSYSGFFDNAKRKATGLDDLLRSKGTSEVDVIGLATDYCVKYTALDALELGYKVRVFTAGIRGVNLQQGDCDRAIEEMQTAGIKIDRSEHS